MLETCFFSKSSWTLFDNSQVVASYLPQVLMQELVVAILQQQVVTIPLLPQVLMPKLVVVIPQQQVATTPFFHRS
jgi:hypothetical protein